ncbi:GDSL-type esterase/lipase family protein [Roseococcus sp.]|uniref:GDSL-type esterase/lipase family protein n=1 Tax=Roseococcus sp. TaxID=2109646 RepID=UPI003BACAFF9
MLNRRGFISLLSAGLAGCQGGASAPRGAEDLPPWQDPIFVAQAAPDPVFNDLLPVSRGGDPFAPLGAALRGIQRGDRDARALVMMIGDSHAAGPVMVEHLRGLFQSRFGAVGVGRLSPGKSQRYFNPSAVTIGQSGEWTARNALRSTSPGPFGLTGYRLSGSGAGDTITLRSDELEGFDRVHLSLMAGPEAGSFRLRVDGNWIGPATLKSARPEFRPMFLDVPSGSREIAIELVGDGQVELLGWGLDRRGRGVLVEAFGINGATLSTLDNRDPEILRRELTARPPALLILEFGTNEATDPEFDEAGYAAALTRHIQRLRQILPRSGILLMGVPDAGRPVRLPPIRRGRHMVAQRQPTGCAAATPLVALSRVRAAQRAVAQSENIAFFDWSAEVTQSPCRLQALAGGDAPLMRADFVHFTPDGYRLTAEKLHTHILRGTGLGPRRSNA